MLTTRNNGADMYASDTAHMLTQFQSQTCTATLVSTANSSGKLRFLAVLQLAQAAHPAAAPACQDLLSHSKHLVRSLASWANMYP